MSTQLWLGYFAPLASTPRPCSSWWPPTSAKARLETSDSAPHRSVLPIAAILGVPLVMAFAIHLRSFADPHLRSIQVDNREAGAWITDNLPGDAVLGSWDAGVVGYFTEQPVINLDGVVNSYEYVEASEEGTQGEFLRQRDLAYIVNHGAVLDGEDPAIHEAVTGLLGEGAVDGLTQEHRVEFTYSGTTSGAGGAASTDEMAVFVYRLIG